MKSDLCGAVTLSGLCLATGALPVLSGRAVILRCTVHRPGLPAEAAPGLLAFAAHDEAEATPEAPTPLTPARTPAPESLPLCAAAVTASGYMCLAEGAQAVSTTAGVVYRCATHADDAPTGFELQDLQDDEDEDEDEDEDGDEDVSRHESLRREQLPHEAPTPLDPPAVGSREWMSVLMETIFDECRALRSAGQVEYARRQDNAFGNFDRVAERRPKVGPEDVLMIYFDKHVDGILAHLDGHTSQREPVEGRINDAIVYLCLLRGLIERRRAREAQA